MFKASKLSDSDRIKLLYIISIITILGNIIDLFSVDITEFVKIVNSTTILLVVLVVASTRLLKMNITYAFWVVVYGLIANILVSHISNLNDNSDLSILRAILIITVLIPASAFLLSRIHSIIIGIINLSFLYFFSFYVKSPFLVHNVSILTLLIVGFSLGMYYIMFLLEQSLKNESLLYNELKSINTQSIFLQNLSFKLVDYFDEKETIPFILKSIKNHTGSQFASFSVYDEQQKALILKSIEVDSSLLKAAVLLGGKKIINTASPLSDENYETIMKEIVGIKHSFTEITFGAIPIKLDKALRKISKTSTFFGIAHIISGKLYGTTVLAFNKKQELPSLELLKSYAHVTALVLRRNLTEKALEVSENKLRRLTDNISDVVFTSDLDFTISYMTPSIFKLTGFKPEEYINISLKERLPESSMKQIQQLYKEEILNELNPNVDPDRTRVFELDLLKKDDTLLHTSIHCSFLRNKLGIPVGLQGVVRDITSIKESENQLKKYSEELKQLNYDKDRFIQILAHDLKNPFNSLLGLSELLKSNYGEFDENQVRFMAETIHSAASRTHNLLDELLLWSRANSGKLPFNPVLFDPKEESLDVIHGLNSLSEKKSLRIECEYHSLDSMFADKTMFRTILRNLLTNAIKFSFPDQRILLSSSVSETDITYSITDFGVGISKEIQQKIWDISFHHIAKGTMNEAGTGLGLIICKELVEIHQGKIGLTSKEGKGSTFYFSIPKKQKLAD